MIANRSRFLHVNFADNLNLSSRPVDFAPATPSRTDDNNDDELLQGENREFLRWLLEHAGVNVAHYRAESLSRRLPACLRALRATSPSHARAILERDRLLLASAVGAVLIGVTSFFRDTRVFDDLDRRVLPHLADGSSRRIWSVGCSDGMELYSVAIQLAERRALHRCQLLGTDCRIEATGFAAAGSFSSRTLSDMPDRIRQNYFTASDSHSYSINPFIRTCVQWRTADVLSKSEPGPWDLILCRNMAMYLRGDAVAKLWDILQKSLRPGGYLVLGKAERPSAATRLSMIAPCIFRREFG